MRRGTVVRARRVPLGPQGQGRHPGFHYIETNPGTFRFRPVCERIANGLWPNRAQTRSVVRLDKLVTVEVSLILGELGIFSDALLEAADDRLRYVLGLESRDRNP